MLQNIHNNYWNIIFAHIPYESLSYPFQIHFSQERSTCEDLNLIKQEQPSSNQVVQLFPKSFIVANQEQPQESQSQPFCSNVRQQKKHFKKDKTCPVRGCMKKYSSRIAMRAHLRKKHPNWSEQTSDYQP